MKHAVIYDRASTQMQGDNWSRVNAKDVGIRIAEQNGFSWEYVKEIGSGTTLTGRPKMMQILDRVAAGEIQIIIVQDLDRLARPEEAIVYSTIRQAIMEYGVVIYTHTSRIDLNNDDDDFVADITMSVAKKERRRIRKRMKRGKAARAAAGKPIGGHPGLGYKYVWNEQAKSDFAIEESEVPIVQAVFDAMEATGGNYSGTAKLLCKQGYTGKTGRPFTARTVNHIANRRLYVGIFESTATDKVTHRPDLQIISVDQFERVQAMIKSRSRDSLDLGRRGRYIFTGFIVCGGCGGPMVAGNVKGVTRYQCVALRKYGKAGCAASRTYSEHLILPPIVEFLSELIQKQLDFHTALDNAASKYGKSITEEAVEAAVKGELASVQAGKDRLVEAISLGVLSTEEAGAKLAELRAQEQRLTVELASIAEKTALMVEWQNAIELLKGTDIKETLLAMAEERPVAFRQLLGFVFEPNSLRVNTEWIESRTWVGSLEGCKLTEAIQMESASFNTPVQIG